MKQSETGLYEKYFVRRNDGRDRAGEDRMDALYFVLDYFHDPYARIALRAYAEACSEEYPLLARDLLTDLEQVEGERPL